MAFLKNYWRKDYWIRITDLITNIHFVDRQILSAIWFNITWILILKIMLRGVNRISIKMD